MEHVLDVNLQKILPGVYFVISGVLHSALSGERGGVQWKMASFLRHPDYDLSPDLDQIAPDLVGEASRVRLGKKPTKLKIICLTNHRTPPSCINEPSIEVVDHFLYVLCCCV